VSDVEREQNLVLRLFCMVLQGSEVNCRSSKSQKDLLGFLTVFGFPNNENKLKCQCGGGSAELFYSQNNILLSRLN
jgi:hypothetical protein